MSEVKKAKSFSITLNNNTYQELLKLEEEQLELEKKLVEQKKNVMRNHLIKTIDENKGKIEAKRNEILSMKDEEKHKVQITQAKLIEENKKFKEEKLRKK